MKGISQHLQIDLKLKRLSAIALGSFLYKHPDVKKKIKKSIANKKKDKDKAFPSNGIRNGIIEVVLRHLNTLKLPEELKAEVESVVALLGDEIARWTKHVIETLRLNITCIDQIYWTPFGTVNDLKIYKKFWKKDHKLSKLNNKTLIFTLACIHVDKEFIKESIDEMMDTSKNFYGPVKILTEDQIVKIIGAYVINYIRGGLDKNEQSDFYKNRVIIDEYDVSALFHICISNALVTAAKFFYSLLNEKEKRNDIISTAEVCLEKGNYWASNGIEELKNAELLLWLINTMPVEQRHYFLMENIDDVMDIFLVALPYQEISLKILDEKWVDLISSKHERMIEKIILNTNMEHLAKSLASRKVFQEALKKMLKIASKKVKEETFVRKQHYNVKDCFDAFDVNFLKLIINDEDLKEFKNEMLEEGNTKIKSLIKSKNFDPLVDFIMEVLVSSDEKREFIKKWELLDKLLMSENLKTVEKFLDSLIESVDEATVFLRPELDTRDMCYRFIEKGNYDLVDKYLKWDYEEQRAMFKKSLADEWSLCLRAFKIWATESNVENAKKRTISVLKWRFNSDEKINHFIKEKLIKVGLGADAVVRGFCQDISKSCKGKNLKEEDYAQKFGNIDELLQFCSISQKDIKEIKKYVSDNIKWWFSTYGTKERDFMTLKTLLNWVYKGNKSEMEKEIKDYLNTTDGVLLLNGIRDSVDDFGWGPFLNFLNTWMKSYANWKKMRKEMRPLDEIIIPAQIMGRLSALILSTSYTKVYTREHTEGLMAMATDFGYKFYSEEDLDC